jgi:hypothetical protein
MSPNRCPPCYEAIHPNVGEVLKVKGIAHSWRFAMNAEVACWVWGWQAANHIVGLPLTPGPSPAMGQGETTFI